MKIERTVGSSAKFYLHEGRMFDTVTVGRQTRSLLRRTKDETLSIVGADFVLPPQLAGRGLSQPGRVSQGNPLERKRLSSNPRLPTEESRRPQVSHALCRRCGHRPRLLRRDERLVEGEGQR